MFDHLSIGVSNLDRSLAFYDAALKPLGINRMFAIAVVVALPSGFIREITIVIVIALMTLITHPDFI